MRYIEDFKEGENIVGHYLCRTKEAMKTKSGKNYLSLKLIDKTGVIDAKVWEVNNNIHSFEAGDFIKVDGLVTVYNNETQFKVAKIRKSLEGEYIKADYIPTGSKDIDEVLAAVLGYIKTIENTFIKQLLENIFIGNKQIQTAFKESSAAKAMHHSYMGGLAEHTLSVVEMADFMSGRYKFVNRDILVSCAMLHDLCKIYELSAFPENDYTDEGNLLGHIVMGAELIEREAAKIDGFPVDLKNLMKHCILSHHGEYEFGSPKKPMIIEAFLLSCCDNTDAKVKMYEEALEKSVGQWTGWNRMLERNIRNSEFL
jgi:3'-5' exoribonuclease